MATKMADKQLYDKNASLYVLSTLMREPLLIENDEYVLTKNDFCQPLQQMVYYAIFNLAKQGVSTISPQDIDFYLKQYPSQYEYYTQNKGYDWLLSTHRLTEGSDCKQFDFYYNRLKKFSMLRDLDALGFDIKEFYDTSKDFLSRDKEDEKLNNIKLIEIPNHIREKLVEIENRHIGKEEGTSQLAAKGLRALVDELKENPEVGLPLDGDILNYATRGARSGKLYIYSAPSGVGKALPDSVLIPTTEGWKKVGDIKPGDQLFDRCGKPTRVLKIFPQGERKVFKVTFKDGRTALCNDEHLWTYHEGDVRYNKNITTTLAELIQKVKENGGYYNAAGGYRYLVPMNGAVEYPTKTLKIDPYVFGLLLGDGSFRQQDTNKCLTFSSATDELPNKIAEIMGWEVKKASSLNYSYYFSKCGKNIHVEDIIPAELINAYSYNKFIPQEYLLGDVQQRKALLQGLMDTDGSIDDKGRCRFTSVGKELVDNFVELCHSLGYKTHIIEDKREKYTTEICYNVDILSSPTEKLDFFRLERKVEKVQKYLNNTKRFENNAWNPIVNIEELDYSESMTCFLVDNEEHLFLMNDFIVTHNTRYMVGNACAISMPYIDENMNVVIRDNLQKVLFVATEMSADEIQTLVLAYVSGVNEKNILLGNYTPDEWKRIEMALDIIEKYNNFIIESIPDPSMAMIKARLAKYIVQDGVEFIYFDYIFSSPGLLSEFRDIDVREDVALMMLSNTLKEVAMTYGVFIQSATQLNDNWSRIETGLRDQTCIRGSKAIVDKVDIGMIATRLNEKEKDKIKEVYEGLRKSNPLKFDHEPNIVIDLYKNRRGEMSYVKIFRWFDHATCRAKDLFITDTSYKAVEIGELKYEKHVYKFEDLKARGEL